MNSRTYRRVLRLAGPFCSANRELVFSASAVRFDGRGIYLACSLDGRIDYVGSSQSVRRRIQAHSLERRSRWHRIWVIPVDGDRRTLEAIEGEVIAYLNPPGNRKRHRYRAVA